MKKILYWLIIFAISICCFQKIVIAQNLDNSVADMELSKYYGVVPLLLDMHKEIGMWESGDGIVLSFASLAQNMKYYADVDVLQYIKKSMYPQSSLDDFLTKTNSILNTSNIFMIHLDNEKKNLIQKKDNCDSLKKQWDKSFSLALKDFDSANMEKYLSISIENEKCSVESRINYNAYEKMHSQIKYYYDILQNKYDYFSRNKYDILEMFK